MDNECGSLSPRRWSGLGGGTNAIRGHETLHTVKGGELTQGEYRGARDLVEDKHREIIMGGL